MKSDPVKDLNLIGAGTVVEGKIRSQGSMRVDGKLIGDLNIGEAVAVGLTGEVEGNISAKNVTVGGKVRGSISALEKIVLETRSVVRGDIRATKLVIDEGALFDGRISMSERATSEVRH